MIVKKLPILQGFPDLQTVLELSDPTRKTDVFSPLFFDIETTGLARNSTFLYLIGAAYPQDGGWMLSQWFAEGPDEEMQLLASFLPFLQKASVVIHYNGDSFDCPYLEQKYRKHGIFSPLPQLSSVDLYRELKPFRSFLKLSGMKQTDLEAFLGIPKRRSADGKACVRLYREYIKQRSPALSDELLEHNREDVSGLGQIIRLLACRSLSRGEYDVSGCHYGNGCLTFRLSLACALPFCLEAAADGIRIVSDGQGARLFIDAPDGRLKRYYDNYREYDYLPLEDTAVPKILGRSIDRSLRKPATKTTCYTWFPVSERFLQDPVMQKEYLRHALPVWLDGSG